MKLFALDDDYYIAESAQEALRLYRDDNNFDDDDVADLEVEEMYDTVAISVYLEEENDVLTKIPSEWVAYFGSPGLAFSHTF